MLWKIFWLSINIKKTKCMIFNPRQKKQTLDHLTEKLFHYTLALESETVLISRGDFG